MKVMNFRVSYYEIYLILTFCQNLETWLAKQRVWYISTNSTFPDIT